MTKIVQKILVYRNRTQKQSQWHILYSAGEAWEWASFSQAVFRFKEEILTNKRSCEPVKGYYIGT